MKIRTEVTKVERICSNTGWFEHDGVLEVTCGKDLAFRVDNTVTSRTTYTIGRKLTVTIEPDKR